MTWKDSIWRYLKMDLYRLFSSWELYISCVLMALLYLLAGKQVGIAGNVYNYFYYNSVYSTYTMSFAICAIPFAACFIEDSESGAWNPQILRGKTAYYCWSKVLICFISGVAVYVLGIMMFIMVARTQMPFINEYTSLEMERIYSRFGMFIGDKMIILFFIFASFLQGLLGGIYALVSALISLYEPYRMLTIVAPFVLFYFLQEFEITLLHLPPYLCVYSIYGFWVKIFDSSGLEALYVLGITVALILLLGLLIRRKVERRVHA